MAQRLTLGDLIYRLGFENEEEFLREVEKVVDRAETEVEEGGREAGRGFGREVERGLDQIPPAARRAGDEAGGSFLQGFRSNINRIGDVFLGNLLSDLFQRATQAVGQFVGDSSRQFQAYEQGLVQLRLAGVENLGAVEEQILATAEASRVFSRVDVSLAVGELVKAGFSADEALTLVRNSANLAASEIDPLTGQFADLGNVSAQTGQILRAMNLDMGEAGRVADVVAKAAQDSSAEISDMVGAIADVGPFATQAGLSLEQVSGAVAVLTNRGIPATEAARGLRSVLASLIDPPAAVRSQFDSLGISLIDATGKARPFEEVLRNLAGVAASGEQGVQLLAQGMDNFALAVATGLGQSAQTVNDFSASLDDAEGAAQELGDTVRDSAAAEFAELQARVEDAKVELGEELTPVMLDVYQNVLPAFIGILRELVGLWNDWYFLIHGTTPALEEAQRQFESQFSPEQLEILEDIQEYQRQIAEFEEEIRRIREGVGRGGPEAFDPELDQPVIDWIEENEIAPLRERLRLRRSRFQAISTPDTPDAGETPPGTPPPVVVPNIPNRTTTDGSTRTAREVDPLIAEAQAVATDVRSRLSNLYEAGRIPAEEYEQFLQGHLRRVQGLYDQATDADQTAAIVQAEIAIQREIQNLQEEAQERTDEALEGYREQADQHAEGVVRRVQGFLLGLVGRGSEIVAEGLETIETAQEEAAREEASRIRRLVSRQREYADSRIEAAEMARRREENALSLLTARYREYYDSRIEGERLAVEEAERLVAQMVAASERGFRGGVLNAIGAAREFVEGLADDLLVVVRRLEIIGATETARAVFEDAQAGREAVTRLSLDATQSYDLLARSAGRAAEEVEVLSTKLELGTATGDELRVALEIQVGLLERLLLLVPEGSEAWEEYAAALLAARLELEELNSEGSRPIPTPDVTGEVTEEGQAYLAMVDDLESRIYGMGERMIQGFRDGDVGGALQDMLGSATDFFVEEMTRAILGPIAKSLAGSIGGSIGSATGGIGGSALGPAGLLLGLGVAFFGAALSGGRESRTEVVNNAARSGRTGGAPAVTYNLEATVNVQAGASFDDPAFYSRFRQEATNLTVDLLQRTREFQGRQ